MVDHGLTMQPYGIHEQKIFLMFGFDFRIENFPLGLGYEKLLHCKFLNYTYGTNQSFLYKFCNCAN
jgi:hypothetical protein